MIWERSQSYKSASPILRKLNIGHRFFHFSFKFHFLNAKSLRGRVNAYWTCAHFFLSEKPLSISLKAHLSSLMTHLGIYIITVQSAKSIKFHISCFKTSKFLHFGGKTDIFLNTQIPYIWVRLTR